MGQFYPMAEEVGFLTHKRGDGRGAKARSPEIAEKELTISSHGAVTREVLDVAR